MKVLLSAIFLVLSLVCGVQGQAECIQEGYDDLWEGSGPMLCGCQLHDADDNPLVNISLDFFDMHTAKRREDGIEVHYSYSPCTGNTSCGDDSAVCRHALRSKSIGIIDNVNYTVINMTRVNISATYLEEKDGTSSVVYLVCDETAEDEGVFSFVRHDRSKNTYYFQLSYVGFCLPPAMTTTKTMTTTTTKSMTTTTKSMTTTTKSMTTTTKSMTTTTKSTTKLPTMTITSTTNMSPTSKPSENKDDKDRKVVLGIVLSIVGAIIIGVIMAIVIYFMWKKKRGASYEKIPTM